MIDPKQIKALFFDVDGTLVSYQNHRIHPQDIKTLAELHERGIKLFIASGRDFAIPQEAATITEAAPYMDGYIGINGQHCELAFIYHLIAASALSPLPSPSTTLLTGSSSSCSPEPEDHESLSKKLL